MSKAFHKHILGFIFIAMIAAPLHAALIAVRHSQGTEHGYLVIRSENGIVIGHGDMIQNAHGTRVATELALHFDDGSLDDETAVYTQNGVLRLISDHHIQRGPYFSNPLDLLVEASGRITSRSIGGNGKAKTEHQDVPADISNGILSATVINIPPTTSGVSVGMVVPVGVGRLVKLEIKPDRQEKFHITGLTETATVFRFHIDLGRMLEVFASLAGKQPTDFYIWVSESPAPQLVCLQGPLAEGRRAVSIELSGTSFTRRPQKPEPS